VLRVAAAAFADESSVAVKLQTVGLAVKLSLRRPADAHAQALATYVLELARSLFRTPKPLVAVQKKTKKKRNPKHLTATPMRPTE
jgi:hypothetical protein